MPINTLDDLLAAPKQLVPYVKTAAITSTAAAPMSVFAVAGSPGAGVLAVGNNLNGIVPTHDIAGYPKIAPFTVGHKGYLSAVTFGSTVSCRLTAYDCLFSAGAFAFNANATLVDQPSYLHRIPNNDFRGVELWIEAATAFTGNQTVTITYLNQDGESRTTGAVALGHAPIANRMNPIPLATGDHGVRQVVSVVSSGPTAGTFNVHVMRRLWEGRVMVANAGDCHDFLKTGMSEIFETSAIRTVVWPDSSNTGVPALTYEIVTG